MDGRINNENEVKRNSAKEDHSDFDEFIKNGISVRMQCRRNETLMSSLNTYLLLGQNASRRILKKGEKCAPYKVHDKIACVSDDRILYSLWDCVYSAIHWQRWQWCQIQSTVVSFN